MRKELAVMVAQLTLLVSLYFFIVKGPFVELLQRIMQQVFCLTSIADGMGMTHEEMTGECALVLSWCTEFGLVYLYGRHWKARLEEAENDAKVVEHIMKVLTKKPAAAKLLNTSVTRWELKVLSTLVDPTAATDGFARFGSQSFPFFDQKVFTVNCHSVKYISMDRLKRGDFVICGARGTGKHLLAWATAVEVDCLVLPLPLGEILKQYGTQSIEFLHAAFSLAPKLGGVMIVLSQLEALGRPAHCESSRRLQKALVKSLNDLDKDKSVQIVMIVNTKKMEKMKRPSIFRNIICTTFSESERRHGHRMQTVEIYFKCSDASLDMADSEPYSSLAPCYASE